MSFSLDELCVRDRDEPTVRELFAFKRHVDREGVCGRDHEPYADCMAWDRWGSTDWSATGRSPRRPRRSPAPIERVAFQHRLTKTDASFPEIVDRCREKLVRSAQAWCDGHGYIPGDGTWETADDGSFPTVLIVRLTTEVTPRTDGEWPAIHQAIREDQADREAATAAGTEVSDRLDALAAAASYWANPEYR